MPIMRLTAGLQALLAVCCLCAAIGAPAAEPTSRLPPTIIIWAGVTVPPGVAEDAYPLQESPVREAANTEPRKIPTSKVAPRLNTKFGIAYVWRADADIDEPYQVVWKAPPPGVLDPKTGVRQMEWTVHFRSGGCVGRKEYCVAHWTIDNEDELLPGPWRVEVRVKGQEPVGFVFTMLER